MYHPSLRFGSLLAVVVAVLGNSELCSSQTIPFLTPRSDWAIRVDSAERPLSGEIVIGAMVGDQNAPADMERISLRVPDRLGSTLCVTVTARDARFRASAEFDLPRGFDYGPIQLAAIKDAYIAGMYRRARIQDIAIRVEIGNSCSDSLRRIVPANWGHRAVQGTVHIYANTEGSSSVRWISVAGDAKAERCLPFTGGGSVAYNVFCPLPEFALGSNVSAVIVQSANARGDARVPFRLTYLP